MSSGQLSRPIFLAIAVIILISLIIMLLLITEDMLYTQLNKDISNSLPIWDIYKHYMDTDVLHIGLRFKNIIKFSRLNNL